ncbi:uncharacterized protein EV154DRAFT_503800 [Mucor mucedo]|uniref:uncharacterized protein n=1 Tax=Mucor mucedo TaxID=29922 RepID=UPI00221F3126|nr:uncharacterized protein EV154DRAFT_503800 [Mucor mucedo]KAI7892862.1 hypothetical protein EV154DRAFT_503800 [Mucor mucedo]
MSSSVDIATATPILIVDPYPSAATMTSQTMHISSPTSKYDIKTSQASTDFNSDKEYTILSSADTVYYYLEPPTLTTTTEGVVIFYNGHQKAVWQLTNRDWHGMTLIYQHGFMMVVLSTTPPQFRFSFHKQFYHWQVIHDRLQCFETESKRLIGELDGQTFVLDMTTTNPFRKSAILEDDPFTTLVLLSGLLVHQHVKNLRKSLRSSSKGMDPLGFIMDPPPATINKEPTVFNNTMYNNEEEEEEEEDIASLSSTYVKNYPGHQSLVDERGTRWSSADSFKSIELDPGVWHCWWGYSFWWSWFPCCMPGGCCDRACIRLKGQKPAKARRTTRTLSKQGWQQQHY